MKKYTQNDDVVNVYKYLNAAKNLYTEEEASEYSDLRARVFGSIFQSVSYLPVKVSTRYSKYADRDDLMQVGRAALYNAIKTFDCTKGEHFFSWSYLWLVKSIKIEAHRQRKYKETFVSKDMKELGTITSSSDDTEEEYETHITSKCIDTALNSINETSSKILRMSYGLGMEPVSLREIGQQVGKSHEWVRSAKTRALQRLESNKYIVEAAL